MGTMKLHPIKTCFFCPDSRFCKSFDYFQDFLFGHFPGYNCRVPVFYFRRSHGDRIFFRKACLPPSVYDLEHNFAFILVNSFGYLPIGFNETVIVDALLVDITLPARENIGIAGYD